MQTKSRFLSLLSIVVILTTILSTIHLPTVSAQRSDGLKRQRNAESGKVSFIGPESGRSVTFTQAMGLLPGASTRPADPAMALAKRFAPEFGLRDAERNLTALKTNEGESGRLTVKYQQNYQGIPVMGGELIVNTNQRGDLYSINGEVSPGLTINTEPAITAYQAKQTALEAMAKWNQKTPEDFTATEPELWIFDESLLQPSSRPPTLVWRMNITSADGSLPIRELMLINAETGNPDFHFNQIDTAWNVKGSAGLIQEPDPTPTPLPTQTPIPMRTPSPTAEPNETSMSNTTASGDVSTFSGVTWYVDAATGNDSNTCLSVASPCKSIQKAINNSTGNDTIRVADGTYYHLGINANPNVIIINKSIYLSGGWKDNFTQQTGVSIVDGEYGVSGSYKNNNGFLVVGGTSTIDRFVIQNSVSMDSGGIYLTAAASLTILNTTIRNNRANSYGAGIYMSGNSSLTLINTTISGNTASQRGGGIYYSEDAALLNIVNSTIVYNTGEGGGLYRYASSGTISIKNTIFANNTRDGNLAEDCKGTFNSVTYSFIENVTGCTLGGSSANKLNIDPQIGNNLTGVPPVHIVYFSGPAVDVGTLSGCPSTDAQGHLRPADGNNDGIAKCDMGAYEFSPLPDVPASLSISSGNNQKASIDESFEHPLVVLVKDNVGNAVNGASVTFTAPLSNASGTFASTNNHTETVTSNASGLATSSIFTANHVVGDPYTINATVADTNLTLSFSLQNMPPHGMPASITILEGNNQQKPVNVPYDVLLRLLVEDPFGDPVSNASVTFTAPANGPSGLFASNGTRVETVQTDASGIATSSIFMANDLAGPYSVEASISGLDDVASFDLRNLFTPGIPASVLVSSGANQKKSINQSFTAPLVARVLDGNGDPVAGANVTFLAPDTGPSGTFASSSATTEVTLTNSSGYATSSRFTANDLAGSYAVYASTTETVDNPATFFFQNLDEPGTPKNMFFIQGNDQQGIVNRAFYTPMKVKVLDDYARPVTGASVTFTIHQFGVYYAEFPYPNEGMESTVVTDVNGVATAPMLIAGPNANGTFTVTVSSSGLNQLTSTMALRSFTTRTFSAQQYYILPGAFLCSDLNIPCTSYPGPVYLDANSAHEHALGTINLYLSKHNRSSVSGSGAILNSSVRYCEQGSNGGVVCPYYNAFWNGDQMVFGSGYNFAGSDDVVAHEMTHGVTDYESNLFYSYQSGAINESLSDLWGEYFDQTNNQGNDATNVKWLIGEETGIPGGAFRNMSNPPQFGDPDKMTSGAYYKGTADNGGVHTNSGVNNKAVALMVDGGSFNGKTIRGLGWDKVAAIYYEVQSNLLGNASNYSDLYYAVQQACINLGLGQDDCFEVKKALDAVEMSAPISGSTYNQLTAPLCPTGMTTSLNARYFYENFDGNAFDLNGWYKDSLIHISPTTAVRTMGGNGVYQVLTLKDEVTIAPNSYMHFGHLYDFEYFQGKYYDGGVVEYSVDGGPWTDAAPLMSAGAVYNATLATYTDNPNQLQGRRAFSGQSDMVSTRVSLHSLANKNLRFRFIYATDESYDWWGWFIDDVKVYQCFGTPSLPTLQLPLNNSIVTDYTPLMNWSDSAPALDHYRVQINDDIDFSSPIIDETVTTSQFQVLEEIEHNTKYYWRVQAFNAVDGTLGWSPVWTFRTALTPPTLVSPNTGDHLSTLRPTFDWEDVLESGVSGYTIQISTSSTFASVSHTGNPITSTYAPSVDLPKGMLYWRVQTKGTNGPGAWSEVRSYQGPNPPPAPLLSAPVTNSLSTTYTPLLKWTAVTMPPGGPAFTHYHLQVDDNNDFLSPVVDIISLTDRATAQYLVSPALDSNKTYYWRVRAGDSFPEYGPWSLVWSFRTALTPPVLTAPESGIVSKELRPMFTWEAVPGATSYTVQISTSSTFAPVTHTGNPTGNFYTPTADLPKNATLYWRVQTKGLNGPSAWTSTPYWSFTTPTTPSPAPALLSPATNALVIDYTPSLSWKPVVFPTGTSLQHYILQVDDDPAFRNIDTMEVNIITSNLSLAPLTDLASNTKFYWRVRTVNNLNEMSNWSPVWNFRTALTPPVLTAPIGGFVSKELRPMFTWEPVSGATGYTIQISTSSSFTPITHTGNPTGNFYTPTVDLPKNATLYWRVQTKGLNGPSAWTSAPHWSFTTPSNPSPAPALLSPATNALVTDYTPTLSWKPVVFPTGTSLQHYIVQVDDNPSFSNVATMEVNEMTTNLSFAPTTDLTSNTRFYWRVRTVNNLGEMSNWSLVWNFRTAVTPPGVVAPLDGATGVSLLPILDWSDVSTNTGYTLQLWKDGPTPVLIRTVTLLPSVSQYQVAIPLLPNTSYFWKVQTKALNGPSTWSQPFHFVTGP